MEYVGIDLGTTNIRGIIYNSDKKEITTQIVRRGNFVVKTAHSWEFKQDAEEILSLSLDILTALVTQSTELAGIGITGQMHGILYTDKDGNAVSDLYTWQDGRGSLLYKDQHNYVDYLREHVRTIDTQHFLRFSNGYGLTTHYFNTVNSLVPDDAQHLTTIMDYFATKLTGIACPKISPCNKAGLGIHEAAKVPYLQKQFEILGLSTDILPEFTDYYTLYGETNGANGGIPSGIPVAVSIGDNQAGVYGTLENIRTEVHLNTGSSGQVSVIIPFEDYDTYIGHADISPDIEIRPYPQGVMCVGAALAFGYAYSCVVDFFHDIILELTGIQNPNFDMLKVLENTADNECSPAPPKFTTTFLGTRVHPEQRASITNITPHNFNTKSIVHATLHGMVQELYDYYKILLDTYGIKREKLVVSGGVVKKNEYLRHIIEDTFKMEMSISKDEGSAKGAALYIHDILTQR